MTLNKSSDRNDFEVDGVRIEITRPHPLLYPMSVYPIPQKDSRVNAFIKLGVRIINDTPIPFHLNLFQSFIPELVTSDGQIIQGYLVTKEVITNTKPNKLLESSQKQKIGWQQIRPESSFGFRLNARLSWQNNSLQLKIPSPANYVLSSNNLHYFWCFDGLQAHTYQFRFILNTKYQPTYALESNLRQKTTISENRSKILATPWVNFRLVYPLSNDSSAIEVDGVQFKVEKPSSVLWTTPPIQTGAKTNVKLGIHVTNNTSTAFRFYQTGSVDATLIDDYGKEINFSSDSIRLQLSHEPKYYLVQPGESAFFNLDGILFWEDGQFQLAIPNKSRHCFTGSAAFYYFHNLKLGTSYHLQLIYHVSESKAKRLQENALETVWNGWIAMPFVEFCLVEP